MTPRLAEVMARAGCRAVFYGIDSGSQPVLDRTVKKVDAEDILPVVRMSKEYFDCIEASFIWGYPFETLSDFRKTLEIAAEAAMLAPTVNVQLHMLSPLPLSPIYQEFPDGLVEPDAEDRSWLLLPAIFQDERAVELRALVRAVRRPRVVGCGRSAVPRPARRAHGARAAGGGGEQGMNDLPIVYLGPSLPRAEAEGILRARYRPPVRRGDLEAVEGAPLVVVIDGEFGQNLSVSPKEILRLLDGGTRVLGASSMGALRAAELFPYGMEGHGWIFENYKSGRITGDDEVALAYSPIDQSPLTVP